MRLLIDIQSKLGLVMIILVLGLIYSSDVSIDSRSIGGSYGVETVQRPAKNGKFETIMRLERMVSRVKGQPTWKPLDSVRVIGTENVYPIGHGRCGYGKDRDDSIVVLMETESLQILGAWTIDIKGEKFKSIPIKNLNCSPQCEGGCNN